MSKDKSTNIDPNLPYESNTIGFSGIVYFGIGLFLLIIITFGLMWVFQYKVLEENALEADRQATRDNPIALSEKDKLPPEPRLQSAPGFGVDGKQLELTEPQAEYLERREQWEKIWEKGEIDTKTKTVISLPIEDAKEKLLKGDSIKARSDEEGKKALDGADFSVSASSSGRVASEKVRK